MIKRRDSLAGPKPKIAGYEAFLAGVTGLLESARRGAARAVNSLITATYWEIGRRMVQLEQGGESRADYGEYLMDRLSADLSVRYGRGFSRRAVYQMRAFYLAYPAIVQTPSAQFVATAQLPPEADPPIVQSPIAQLPSPRFPLTWTHYVRLLAVKNESARNFYETEALRCGWSIRQLDRQIDSLYYERTALSKNKAAMLAKGRKKSPGDAATPEEEIKDPFVLEFLQLKDEYSETQLEEAMKLPDEATLANEMDRTRRALEIRSVATRGGTKK